MVSTTARSTSRSKACTRVIDRLVALYDELDIRDTAPRAITDADVGALESVLHATNELQAELRPVSTYLYALITTDSRNDRACVAPRRAPDRGARRWHRWRSGSVRGSRRSVPTS